MDKDHKDDVYYKNRYDVTVIINGLPLVQVELKRPGVEINEAINQINKYRKFSFKGLFRYLQLFVVSNSDQTKYFCNENEMENGLYNHPNEFLLHLNTDSFSNVNVLALGSNTWVFAEDAVAKILEKLNKLPLRLSDVFEKIYQGIATSKDDVYFLYNCESLNNTIKGFSKQVNRIVEIEQGLVKPLLKGEDVHRFKQLPRERFVIFPYKIENEKAILYSECELQSLFPKGYAYLKECEPILRGREKGRLQSDIFWYRYIYPKSLTCFNQEKLVAPEISIGGNFVYDINGEFYHTTKVYGYIKKHDIPYSYYFLLALMNSTLFWFFLKHTGSVLRGGYYTFKTNYIMPFPIPKFQDIPQDRIVEIENLSKKIIELSKENNVKSTKMLAVKIDSLIASIYGLTQNEINELC